jgi:hypothetical protein
MRRGRSTFPSYLERTPVLVVAGKLTESFHIFGMSQRSRQQNTEYTDAQHPTTNNNSDDESTRSSVPNGLPGIETQISDEVRCRRGIPRRVTQPIVRTTRVAVATILFGEWQDLDMMI